MYVPPSLQSTSIAGTNTFWTSVAPSWIVTLRPRGNEPAASSMSVPFDTTRSPAVYAPESVTVPPPIFVSPYAPVIGMGSVNALQLAYPALAYVRACICASAPVIVMPRAALGVTELATVRRELAASSIASARVVPGSPEAFAWASARWPNLLTLIFPLKPVLLPESAICASSDGLLPEVL